MSPAIVDPSLAALISLVGLGVALVMYVWTALALAAMFRKMGEEPWKGWVPLLNAATVLAWGGFSPWLILLVLIPGVGAVVVFVLLIVAAHRVNPGFGYGTGMTVLAALLFVVWASILGFGPARWLGARAASSRRRDSAAPVPPPLPTPSSPAVRAFAPDEPVAAASAGAPAAPASAVPAVVPLPRDVEGAAPPRAAHTGAAPLSAVPQGAPVGAVPATPASASSWAPPPPPRPAAVVPEAPSGPDGPDGEPTAPADATDGLTDDADGVSDVSDAAADAKWPSEIDDVSAVSPAPFPPSSAAGRPHVNAPPIDTTGGGATGPSTGAPGGPISFVPGRKAAVPSAPTDAPVTRVPALPADRRWAPTSAGESYDPDAFPEMSGEVSAVVGSPAAGAPRSALHAVSAQHRRNDPLEGDDDIDQTVIARRRRHAWELIPASGSRIGLTAKVVILGRHPAPDPAFPNAQLVPLDDDTRTVSKTHARLELRDDGWQITDLHSTNGVLLPSLLGSEMEIEPGRPVPAGDRFLLGDAEMRLVRGDG